MGRRTTGESLKIKRMRPYWGLSIHRGFSLIELLTVIGIIAILTGLLIPALSAARRSAQTTQCASNMRQLTTAMMNYTVEFKGYFPGNRGDLDAYWYDRFQIGRYLRSTYGQSNSEQCIGGAFLCPADLPDAQRSYSMNVWAGGFVSPYVEAQTQGDNPKGKLWRAGASPSSKLFLLIEAYSGEDWPNPSGGPKWGLGTSGKWSSFAVVGLAGGTPGGRFISGGEASPRFGVTASEIPFYRHRRAKQPGGLGDAVGRVNIAFADGHVSLHDMEELVEPNGRSSMVAMWSPIDEQIENRIDQQGQ